MSKYGSLDVVSLYAKCNASIWNKMLDECMANDDINRLGKIRYQIQAGMAEAAKKKLNTPEMNNWFLRLNRSIEITAKKIIKRRIPMPGDDPLAKGLSQGSREAKKKRDLSLATFLRMSAY